MLHQFEEKKILFEEAWRLRISKKQDHYLIKPKYKEFRRGLLLEIFMYIEENSSGGSDVTLVVKPTPFEETIMLISALGIVAVWFLINTASDDGITIGAPIAIWVFMMISLYLNFHNTAEEYKKAIRAIANSHSISG
jgi:hypothetical protein